MKKMFQLVLLVLLSSANILAQTTVVFPDGKIASEDFVKSYVESKLLKEAPPVKLPPVVIVTPPDKTGLTPCEAGPHLKEIYSIHSDNLTYLFAGAGVKGIDWQILKEGSTLRGGNVKPERDRIRIDYVALPSGNYTLRISGSNCEGASTREFSISGRGGDPVVVIPPAKPRLEPCEEGPEIKEILSASESAIDLRFHGVKVEGLDLKISSDRGVGRSGSLRPGSNVISYQYEKLPAGQYMIQLFGNTCAGASKMVGFKIEAKSTGQVTPPKEIPGNTLPDYGGDRTGNDSPDFHFIGQTDTNWMKIQVTGTPGNWILNDIAPNAPPKGYEDERYLINDVEIRGQGRLKDYKYLSNGVLTITKHFVNPALPGLGYWQDDNRWRGGGATFSSRSDVGCQAVIYFEADDSKPGLAWNDQTPAWWKGTPVPSAFTAAPAMRLPLGKYMTFDYQLVGTSDEDRMARGETFTKFNKVDSLRSNWVLNTDGAGIENEKGSREDFRRYADRLPLTGTFSFQTGESSRVVPDVSDRLRWMVERLMERYKQSGRADFLLGAGYGGYDYQVNGEWPEHGVVTVAEKRKAFSSVDEIFNRDSYLRFYKGTVNTIYLKNYGTSPSNPTANLQRVAKNELVKRAGFKAIMFGWEMYEAPGQTGWARGFGWQHDLPKGGRVVTQGMSVQAFDDAQANAFASLYWGDGFRIWGVDKINNNPATVYRVGNYYGLNTVTISAGAKLETTPEGGYPAEPGSSLDAIYIGAYTYNQCRITEGGEKRYNAFTLAGTSYPAEPDGADALVANSQKRGVLSVRTLGDNATIVFWDPFASNVWKQLSTVINGKTFTGWVYGRRLYSVNVKI